MRSARCMTNSKRKEVGKHHSHRHSANPPRAWSSFRHRLPAGTKRCIVHPRDRCITFAASTAVAAAGAQTHSPSVTTLRPLAATRKRVPPLTHRQGQGPNSNPELGLGVGTTLPGGHIIAPRLRLVSLSPSFSRCPPATSASHFLGSCLLAPSSVYILPALFFLTLCR